MSEQKWRDTLQSDEKWPRPLRALEPDTLYDGGDETSVDHLWHHAHCGPIVVAAPNYWYVRAWEYAGLPMQQPHETRAWGASFKGAVGMPMGLLADKLNRAARELGLLDA